MKTDSLFYRLFQDWPGLALELAGLDPSAAGYALRAEEIKQTGFRLDGVLAPPDDQPDAPLVANERELAEQAPTAWRRLESLTEPGFKVLLDVFLSWLMERHKGRNFEEIMRMLQVLTPLEETVAYPQLVGIGKQKEAQAILRKLLARRFGILPPWAMARLEHAETAQLEAWADGIFDAASLEELLGRE